MKKGVKLIISVCALAVIVVAWMLVKNAPQSDIGTEDTTTLLYVVETDPALLRSITLQFGGETYKYVYGEGKWQNPADGHMPLDQTTVATAASALTTIACNRSVVDNNSNDAEYGLDSPSYIITLGYSDGTEVEYYIGDQNIHTKEYYFSLKGKAGVYSVNPALLEYCTFKYEDILALDKIEEIDPATVTSVTTLSSLGTITFTPGERVETSVNAEGETEETTVTFYTLKNEAGEETELDAETGSAVLEGLLSPVIVSCADYYVTEEELSAYGLDNAVTVTVDYTVQLDISTETSSGGKVSTPMQYKILFGFVKDVEGGADKVYMQFEDSNMVFEVNVNEFASLF